MTSRALEGPGFTPGSTFDLFAHQLIDPVSKDWMVDAVALTHCGHTLSQRTADACIERGLPCPIGEPHEMSPYVQCLAIRQIIQLCLAAYPASTSFATKGLGNNAETNEKLMSAIADIFSELKVSREKLKIMEEELQYLKREYEKNQAREQAFQVKEQVKERFAFHLDHSLEVEALKKYFGAECLELGFYTDITKILSWPCPIWPNKTGLLGLTEVMQLCPNLTTLSLTWCKYLENEDMEAIATCFPNLETNQSWKMSYLRHLDLSNCRRVADAGLAIIGQNCPNLQELILNGCSQITDLGIQILSYNIGGSPNCPQLQTLNLSGTRITDQAIAYIIRFCRDIQSLDLSYCESITDKGVISIAQTYRQNLHTLNLQGCSQLTDASITKIAQNC